jgi:uncharacterized membrane protein YdcZ (DUF606 family)
MLAGGVNGALHTSSTVFLSQRLGTTVFFNLLTGGTLLGSLAQDAFGAFGGVRRPTTLLRLVAVALTFGGTVLTQAGTAPTVATASASAAAATQESLTKAALPPPDPIATTR